MKTRLGRLTTTPVTTAEEVRVFFDRFAPDYSEQHGSPQRMLRFRLKLIKEWAHPGLEDVVLDLGCGTGHHLMALHPHIGQGIGIDFSRVMIEIAKERLEYSGGNGNLTFRTDDARILSTVQDRSVDLAMCIGSLEHMLDQDAVLRHAYRVLKPGGRFVCLTPNGNYIWYRLLAPWLGLDTRHLSTDRFLTEPEFGRLLAESGFQSIDMGRWSFVPRGDLHPLVGSVLVLLGTAGRLLGMKDFQGGLMASAVKGERT
ncbi:MAG: class I SAM-dependent methyltransferase [Fidelibacterota bacterium]